MPAGYRWVGDDCGRGWSIISGRRATFIALAFFLAKCRMGSSTHADDEHGSYENLRASPQLPPPTKLRVRVTVESDQPIILGLAFNINITYQSLVDRIDAKLRGFTNKSIHNGTLKLRHRDEDGDLVAIEGDDDLNIALIEAFQIVSSGGVEKIELFCAGDIA
ncbi:hypothetical protein LRP88_14845 [Fusarium phalaenopsidis]